MGHDWETVDHCFTHNMYIADPVLFQSSEIASIAFVDEFVLEHFHSLGIMRIRNVMVSGVVHGGLHGQGGTTIAGWFMSGKIPSRNG